MFCTKRLCLTNFDYYKTVIDGYFVVKKLRLDIFCMQRRLLTDDVYKETIFHQVLCMNRPCLTKTGEARTLMEQFWYVKLSSVTFDFKGPSKIFCFKRTSSTNIVKQWRWLTWIGTGRQWLIKIGYEKTVVDQFCVKRRWSTHLLFEMKSLTRIGYETTVFDIY